MYICMCVCEYVCMRMYVFVYVYMFSCFFLRNTFSKVGSIFLKFLQFEPETFLECFLEVLVDTIT